MSRACTKPRRKPDFAKKGKGKGKGKSSFYAGIFSVDAVFFSKDEEMARAGLGGDDWSQVCLNETSIQQTERTILALHAHVSEGGRGVPDGGAALVVIGQETLEVYRAHLKGFGLEILDVKEPSNVQFRFGNSSTAANLGRVDTKIAPSPG